jgi:hypothetical protein
MAETFKERETVKPIERQAPAIQREQREIHGPLDTLSRTARAMRIPNEQTRPGGPKAVARTDMDMRVARNVSELRLDGSISVPARFQKLLESMQG